MVRKVFWENPYLDRLETRIAAVDGDDVWVQETIFYALSGGQESDEGTIGGHRVVQARKQGREIVYTLDPGHGLKPGDPVAVCIDWPRRYALMRLHFAAEIILELMYRKFGSIRKIGAHIGRDKARIDFEWPESVSGLLPDLRREALDIVTADQAIESGFSDTGNERRYWKIDAFARVPCGGTHLRRTGEVGDIALKRKNVGRGKERIEITVGEASAAAP